MTSEEINAAVRHIDNSEAHNFEINATGKCFPYIGWFWRDIDFDARIPIGHLKHPGNFLEPAADWKGIIANNKWGYEEWDATVEESQMIRDLFVQAIQHTSRASLEAVYHYIQTLTPTQEK